LRVATRLSAWLFGKPPTGRFRPNKRLKYIKKIAGFGGL
jgi:hypothetical protein